MAKVLQGERVGRHSTLDVGCTAVLFDDDRRRILLTRRRDNGRWCLPGGHVEAGESVAESCARETQEEIGLLVEIERIIGIYSSPNRVIEYQDGNRYQMVNVCCEVTIVGGELGLSDETSEYGYFTHDEIAGIDLMEDQVEIVADVFADQVAAFLR